MITLEDVKKNPQILEFINQTEEAMTALSYTNHGLRHSNIVAQRATQIAKSIGLLEREGELAAIAGFCHDMGNFMTRTFHHFFGALLFGQVFTNQFDPKELERITEMVIENNQKAVADFKNGKKESLGFLIGQTQRLTKGKANPALDRQLLLDKLES